jgi:hypothetical protein
VKTRHFRRKSTWSMLSSEYCSKRDLKKFLMIFSQSCNRSVLRFSRSRDRRVSLSTIYLMILIWQKRWMNLKRMTSEIDETESQTIKLKMREMSWLATSVIVFWTMLWIESKNDWNLIQSWFSLEEYLSHLTRDSEKFLVIQSKFENLDS